MMRAPGWGAPSAEPTKMFLFRQSCGPMGALKLGTTFHSEVNHLNDDFF
jgi:hypothetical protein